MLRRAIIELNANAGSPQKVTRLRGGCCKAETGTALLAKQSD